jgi:hypothetical protein
MSWSFQMIEQYFCPLLQFEHTQVHIPSNRCFAMYSSHEPEVRFISTIFIVRHEKGFRVLLQTMSVGWDCIGFFSYELSVKHET